MAKGWQKKVSAVELAAFTIIDSSSNEFSGVRFAVLKILAEQQKSYSNSAQRLALDRCGSIVRAATYSALQISPYFPLKCLTMTLSPTRTHLVCDVKQTFPAGDQD
jgi:hypothetical protein